MNLQPFDDFETAGRAVLKFLHQKLGFDLWMLTRTEGDDWIVLQAEDLGYGVTPGTVFRWADSFCSEMVKGNGPRIAPRSDQVPAYLAAPIGAQVKIKAYVGVPLVRTDGALFGTLCAIHPSSQPESIVEQQELVELLGALLSMALHQDLRLDEERRRSERLATEAMTDKLTGLFNRRGWEQLLDFEENRCRRYGHSAAVTIVDLDELKTINDAQGHGAGDAILVAAADALRAAARTADIVSRVGGDEFALLSVECDHAGAAALLKRVRTAFREAGIAASVGTSNRIPSVGLLGAWEASDELMYEDKRAR